MTLASATQALVPAPLPAAWLRRAILGLDAALVGVGVLLVLRRLDGAIDGPPSLVFSVTAAAVVASVVWSARSVWSVLATERTNKLLSGGGSLAMALVAAACALPEIRALDFAIWLPILVADQFHRQAFLEGRCALVPIATPLESPRLLPAPPGPPLEFVDSHGQLGEEEDAEQLVLQSLTRTRDLAGAESIHGTLSAEFAVGQRHVILHVGFCPPLAHVPEVEAESAEGPDATVKIVQAFAHGARLEVRLAEPTDEPCVVGVEFAAR